MTQATVVISSGHRRSDDADCVACIDAANRASSRRAIVPGRYWQRADVPGHAGLIARSLTLAEPAAQADAGPIAHCGAHCMAEAAAVRSHINRADLPRRAWCIESWVGGHILNARRVTCRGKRPARRALQRMLDPS